MKADRTTIKSGNTEGFNDAARVARTLNNVATTGAGQGEQRADAAANAAREIAAEFNRPEAASWVEAIIERHFPPTDATPPAGEI
jgi:type IV secretory pathway TrbL component